MKNIFKSLGIGGRKKFYRNAKYSAIFQLKRKEAKMQNNEGPKGDEQLQHDAEMEIVTEGNKSSGARIQWDEKTIAEHDRERGSRFRLNYICNNLLILIYINRQKIDEAPTPYRYTSESDQSECESGSDGESLSKGYNREVVKETLNGNSIFPFCYT